MLKLKMTLQIVFTIGLLVTTACGGDDGPSTPDASTTTAADASTTETGTKVLFESCTDGSECASGLCYNYTSGGMLCSQTCTMEMPGDCPNGCNGMDVCKR